MQRMQEFLLVTTSACLNRFTVGAPTWKHVRNGTLMRMFPGMHMNELLDYVVAPRVLNPPLLGGMMALKHPPMSLGHLCIVALALMKTIFRPPRLL